MIASSAGTSMPSVRHRALVRIRHSPSGASSFSHERLLDRVIAFCVPSTCRTWQRSWASSGPPPSSMSADMQLSITCGKYSANPLDSTIVLLKATALVAGRRSLPKSKSVAPRLRSPFQHPTIRPPLSMFSSELESDSRSSRSVPTFSRSTSNIKTL